MSDHREAAKAARRDPASLRRRGLLYLALGVGLTLWTAMRFNSGDTGVLTVVLLVIGVADILGGGFLLYVSRRIAQGMSGQGMSGPGTSGQGSS